VAARPAEFSITAWLDPVLEYFAREAGISTADYSAQVGGEGIGVGLEVLADVFTKGWLNKLVQFIAGGIASGYAIWGEGVPVRLRKELLALGTHELLRFVDPKPSDMEELQRSIFQFADAVSRGDWTAAMSTILRSPEEMARMLGMASPTPPPPQAPPPTPRYPRYPRTSTGIQARRAARAREAARYQVAPKAPAQAAPAPTKTRYQVTG